VGSEKDEKGLEALFTQLGFQVKRFRAFFFPG